MNLYTSIDLGSHSIKIVVSEKVNDKFYVLASTKVRSMGIKKGIIKDKSLALESIKQAVLDINNSLGIEIKKDRCGLFLFNIYFTRFRRFFCCFRHVQLQYAMPVFCRNFIRFDVCDVKASGEGTIMPFFPDIAVFFIIYNFIMLGGYGQVIAVNIYVNILLGKARKLGLQDIVVAFIHNIGPEACEHFLRIPEKVLVKIIKIPV